MQTLRPTAVTLLAWAALTGAATAQAPVTKGAPERDLRQLLDWLPGDYDNAEQYFFAKEDGAAIARRRVEIRRLDGEPTRIRIRQFEGDAPTPRSDRTFTTAAAGPDGDLRLTAPGCVLAWRRRGAQFETAGDPAACPGAGDALLGEDDLWLGDARLKRARAWTCWMAVPREGKADSWFYASGLTIADQGGEAWVKTDDALPREFGYRLRQVQWPAGANQNALTLYVLRRGEPKAAAYAWADPKATRIGLNLRWMQGSCSR